MPFDHIETEAILGGVHRLVSKPSEYSCEIVEIGGARYLLTISEYVMYLKKASLTKNPISTRKPGESRDEPPAIQGK